jgi:putative transposase
LNLSGRPRAQGPTGRYSTAQGKALGRAEIQGALKRRNNLLVPQSLANVLVHVVFSTKHRDSALSPIIQEELHPYLVGTLNNLGCPPLQVGGVEDHVHLLFALSRTKTIAEVVEKTKTGSSKWLKAKGPKDFSWQAGYGVFSIGPGEVDRMVAYVRGQEAHHAAITFKDEFRALLQEAGMVFDERYVWD